MFSQLSVSKDFSLSMNVPFHLIRGEEIVLEVHVINHLERDIEVRGADAAPVDPLSCSCSLSRLLVSTGHPPSGSEQNL